MSSVQPLVRDSIIEDILVIAPSLRLEDRIELETVGALTPEKALALGFSGNVCKTIVDRFGEPVAMFGIFGHTKDDASIWLLGTPGLFNVRKFFLKNSKEVIDNIRGTFKNIGNFVDSRNKTSIKWLNWCGFEKVGEHIHNDVKFYHYTKEAA